MSTTGSAPASSANLGPGFDCVALALDLRCTVTVDAADRWQVKSDGRDPGRQAVDFITRVVRTVGEEGPLAIEIQSDIPPRSGLGSSAALAAAAAVAVLRHRGEDPNDLALYELVSRAEGHPDNAAAAVFGGLVAAAGPAVLRLELAPELIPVVAVPAQELATAHAREALPASVDHSVAARSVRRAIALVEGLRTGDRVALAAAAGDELHEEPRFELAPGAVDLMSAARAAGARHAAWSGAGPSVIALTTEREREGVVAALEDVLAGSGGRVLLPGVAVEGWR